MSSLRHRPFEIWRGEAVFFSKSILWPAICNNEIKSWHIPQTYYRSTTILPIYWFQCINNTVLHLSISYTFEAYIRCDNTEIKSWHIPQTYYRSTTILPIYWFQCINNTVLHLSISYTLEAYILRYTYIYIQTDDSVHRKKTPPSAVLASRFRVFQKIFYQ